jgi:hypothetical protein
MQISSRGEETPSESADGEAIEVLGSDGPQQGKRRRRPLAEFGVFAPYSTPRQSQLRNGVTAVESIVGTGRRFEST